MNIPKFEFLLKDAADRDSARRFAEALASSGKFTRNSKSQILFDAGDRDYLQVASKNMFCAILADAGVIEITGDLGESCGDCLWMWVNEYKWKLARTGSQPYNPDKPLPVRGVPYQAPALNTPEKAFQRVQR